MSAWTRILERLLPDGRAWRRKAEKRLTALIEGLGGAFANARTFADEAWLDLFPSTTRALPKWERQFGIEPLGVEAERRSSVAAAWRALGGQSPHYLQGVLQAAGFPLFVHEWWESGPDPWVARDPRDWTNRPLIGTVQCGEPRALCGEPTALANRFLVNEPDYIVNLDLTPRAPAPVPDDPARWPFFVYVGGETFGTRVQIPRRRRRELERVLLAHFPTEQWIVTLVDYVDAGFPLVTAEGDALVTGDGNNLVWV
jgi:hypothetical protein